MKAVVAAFNQEKALVGAFSVIVKTGCGIVEPMDRFAALHQSQAPHCHFHTFYADIDTQTSKQKGQT